MTTSAAAIVEVLALNAEGVTHNAIARSVGVSRSTVQRIIRRPDTHMVSVRLSQLILQEIKQAAAATGRTIADELRQVLCAHYLPASKFREANCTADTQAEAMQV